MWCCLDPIFGVFSSFSKVGGAQASRGLEQPSGKLASWPRVRIRKILIDFGRNLEDFKGKLKDPEDFNRFWKESGGF